MSRYEIRPGKYTPCELISITKTNSDVDKISFIAEGTHTYCNRILKELENK